MRIHIKRKKLVIAVLAALSAAAGTAGVVFGINSGEKEEVIGENQSLIYAYVTSIEGNEVTYMEVEESVAEAAVTAAQGREGQTSDEDGASGESSSFAEDSSSVVSRTGESSDGEETSMETRPERGENSAGTTVEGTDDASMEQPPTGAPAGEKSTELPQEGGFEKGEAGSGSTVTTYIPVGVTVHTASDNETTFSRLAAGDLLKILVENDDDGEQVIVEIWMLL